MDSRRYGSNFLNLDHLKSSNADPAHNSGDGAQELHFIYRGRLSPNEIFGLNAFPAGPIRDITFDPTFEVEVTPTGSR